ncbi:slipin family protein [Raoultibacter phocaeensis]|uniref:slipin family protein n=1 Tax=Raoultibacter phocaeensis TaxID=2479841 RepID=UPI001118DCAD|nr:slipin family protein [Raoultibacter phocaeensis]
MKKSKANELPAHQDRFEFDSQSSTTSRSGAMAFSAAAFAVPAGIVLAATWSIANVWTVLAALFVGFLCFLSAHIAYEWEKAVIVRFGKFNRIVGPGIYFTIPIVESETAKIDQRIRTISFDAEETLSSDLVPVNVDTVLFWVVWDVERACKQVRNYEAIISLAAQTAMRDVIGQICLSEIAMRRTYLDEELKRIISEKVDDWGITVVSVEIRDIVIPKELQAAMSRQAQAERERDARLILAEVERDISDMYVDAATNYGKPEKALQLRTMNLVYDSVKEHGGMVVVPSAYSEGFNEAASKAVKDILE